MSTAVIEVMYGLYTDDDGAIQPVDSQADKDIESALRDADTYKRVEAHADPVAQGDALHAYVQTVPFDLPAAGHVIDLAARGDSRWDPDTKTWIRPLSGASIYYPVRKEGAANAARLFLAVWTNGAVGQPLTGSTG